ncbi:MAG: 4Fe-4S cluster-binding domain-containing protein [Chlorobiales bacterium]|nr:4Fe-4S cluster-binding domain-containing protein [Chlorobiales bacterium]
MISFFLTTKCDLRCVYCYNCKERLELEEKTLPLEIAKAGIDEFFTNNKSRHIRFYGPGEPTQEFELMSQIADYARQKGGKEVTTELQTNGAFNSKVRGWLLDNLNIVWVSFDGPPDIQNQQRPFPNNKPSAPIIEENILWLHRNRGNRDLMVGARVTMTSLNIHRQIEMVDYFCSLGIRYIWTDPEFPAVEKNPVCDDEKKYEQYEFNMELYVDNFIKAYKYARLKNIFYGSFLTCNFDGETKIHCRACTPVPHLTPDGYVSACDLVVFGANKNHMNCFIYGKWNKQKKQFEYYPKRLKAMQDRSVDNISHCKDCFAKLHCGGYCLGEVVNETGMLDGQKPIVCRAIRTLLKEIGPLEKFDYLHP